MNFYNEHDPKAAAWLRELIRARLIPAGDVDTRSITEIKAHELTKYTQCHFFAGIGGWSLALALAGWDSTRPVWTGSCPCQPFSSAGKQLAQADARHLWPVFFNLIRECRPECVFGEQVANAIGKGWLDGVSTDLERAGYACGATVLGAHSVGSPHIRQRLYWVADAAGGLDSTKRTRPNLRAISASNGGDTDRLANPLGSRLGGRDERGLGAGGEQVAQQEDGAHPANQSGNGGENAGWQRVVFSGDTDEDGNCPVCGIDYADCGCPGPTQDEEYEYAERDGILFARRLVLPVCTRLEGHAGNGDDGHKPGRFDADEARPVAETSGDCWSTFDIIPCADGKARRIEPGLAPLAYGIPARVVRLRGYGNAIVPQVAAEFVQAFLEVTS